MTSCYDRRGGEVGHGVMTNSLQVSWDNGFVEQNTGAVELRGDGHGVVDTSAARHNDMPRW